MLTERQALQMTTARELDRAIEALVRRARPPVVIPLPAPRLNTALVLLMAIVGLILWLLFPA